MIYDQVPSIEGVVVDGVHRHPPTGIKVVIVGAGLAGLLAALECWRKGHEVEVVEKASSISLAGDIVGVGPSAWVTIQEYPTMFKDWETVPYDTDQLLCCQDGRLAVPIMNAEHELSGVAKHAIWPLRVKFIWFRRDMAFMFLAQAQRLGIPITWGANIIDYSEDEVKKVAIAHADDGSQFTGDVVIAAEGLSTKSHGIIIGMPIQAVSTGYCADRTAYSTAELKDAPCLKKVLEEMDRAQVRLYNGHRFHAVLILTKDRISIIATHEDDGTAVESWSATVSKEQIVEALPSDHNTWDPVLIEAIKNTPTGNLVRWKLCWRDPQPKWTSAKGRVVQIGDAAHSFLPTSASGALMALEDSISLAECLRRGGKEGAGAATRVHQLLRYQRTTLVQHTGFVNRRELHNVSMEEVTKDGGRPLLIGKWVWTHNAEKYVADNFDAARAHIEKGWPFLNYNLPVGHKFEHWTMDSELEKEKSGVFTQDLKTNGDWGLV